MYLSPINYQQRVMQNKQYVRSGIKFEPNAKLVSFVTPCDAQYLIKNADINFKSKYNLKKLPEKELNALKADVKARILELGITNFKFTNCWEQNYTTQAIDKIIKSPIMKKGNIAEYLDNICAKITTTHREKEDSEALLEFVDFLLSNSAKSVMENNMVRDFLGDILRSCDCKNIKAKMDFINYLNNNSVLLNKDINWSEYIKSVRYNNYNHIINTINLQKPPQIPPIASNYTIGTISSRVEEILKTSQEEKNKGRVENSVKSSVKGFAKVGGQKKAIETLQRKFIFPRNFPELYAGVKPEKGAILYGPPGTGKSLLADALSEECGCYFKSIGASDMTEKWVGSSEENWRNLFTVLENNQPAILFIDEADALCKKRGGQDVHGDKELNQFLKLMSDLKAKNVDVSVILATNNLKAFDMAVLRDGRFGTHIEMLGPQNINEVEEIFNIHKKNLKLDMNVEENKQEIFEKMLELKLTGAEIEGVLKESHEEALYRLGLIDKMRSNSVSKSDIENFSIKLEDILKALAQKKSTNNTKIGFR